MLMRTARKKITYTLCLVGVKCVLHMHKSDKNNFDYSNSLHDKYVKMSGYAIFLVLI